MRRHTEDTESFPFTRGIQPTMYRGPAVDDAAVRRLRHGEESNARYRYLLAQGVSGLSVAFDLPTQMGYDSDHPLARGEVGRVGVAIDSIEDMARCSTASRSTGVDVDDDQRDGDHPARAVRRGRASGRACALARCPARSRTTSSRSTSRAAPTSTRRAPSLRIVTDIFAFCERELPNWNTISISGYHIREAGSTAVQEVAFTFANAIAYVQAAIDAGLDVNSSASGCRSSSTRTTTSSRRSRSSAPRGGCGRDHARPLRRDQPARAAAALPHADRRQHAHRAAADNNIVRVALQALAAVLGGTQSLHCNGRDEALALPTEESARIALRTQQIIAHESGVANTVDPVGGSYAIEALTDEIERGARRCSRASTRRRHAGGDRAGLIQREIQERGRRRTP
jgi:methylmalonyl-CoA mutase N-terminal domain/subunit